MSQVNTDADPGFRQLISQVAAGTTLSADESSRAFDIMMSGATTPAQTAAFLMALRGRDHRRGANHACEGIVD